MVETGSWKQTSRRFMSSFSHRENGWKKWEKTVRFNVFWRDYMDLTDASGFNGVEQCEKCLSWCNSKVHHTTFIWNTTSLALALSLCFIISLFSCVSLFLLTSCALRQKELSHSHFYHFLFCFFTTIKKSARCSSISLLNWLNLNPNTFQFWTAQFCWTIRTEVPRSGDSTHVMYYPHNPYYFNKISLLLFFLLKHVWLSYFMIKPERWSCSFNWIAHNWTILLFNHITVIRLTHIAII